MENLYSWVRRSLSKSIQLKNKSFENPRILKQDDDEEEELYGVNHELIHLINSFTLDTFRNFPLEDEEGARSDDSANPKSSGNINNDLSEWHQRHAILVLSKVKELSQLRFKLCPRYLKERDFWRIYFTLTKNILAEYELRAVRLHKLNQMRQETDNVSNTSAYEVEMSETKLPTA